MGTGGGGGGDRRSRCHMSNLRNGHVAVSNLVVRTHCIERGGRGVCGAFGEIVQYARINVLVLWCSTTIVYCAQMPIWLGGQWRP